MAPLSSMTFRETITFRDVTAFRDATVRDSAWRIKRA
jgi:hypothetical protein